MSAKIDIVFSPAEGAILRILGLVERRGYSLSGVSAANGLMALEVEPLEHQLGLDTVAAQLRRLEEVRQVTVLERGHGR